MFGMVFYLDSFGISSIIYVTIVFRAVRGSSIPVSPVNCSELKPYFNTKETKEFNLFILSLIDIMSN